MLGNSNAVNYLLSFPHVTSALSEQKQKFLHDSQMALETQFHSNHTDKMHACPHKVVQDDAMPDHHTATTCIATTAATSTYCIDIIYFQGHFVFNFISCDMLIIQFTVQ